MQKTEETCVGEPMGLDYTHAYEYVLLPVLEHEIWTPMLEFYFVITVRVLDIFTIF